MKKCTFILFLLLGTHVLWAQDIFNRYSGSLHADSLMQDVKVLASDSMEGRETGERGQELAAKYILEQFRQIGLRPGRDMAFLQTFELNEKKAGGARIKLGSTELEFLKDYYFFSGFDEIDITGESVVFAGYGIDDEKYSDYKDIEDVSDKILVVLDGEPVENGISKITGTEKFSVWTTSRYQKSNAAQERKAKAMIVLTNDFNTKIKQQRHYIERSGVTVAGIPMTNSLPVFYLDAEVWNRIAAETGSMDLLSDRPQGTGFSLPVSIQVQKENKTLTGDNVIAYFQGTSTETVVLTAHYDHLGMEEGRIYNGADDNASGTAGIMAIARSLGRTIQDTAYKGRSLMVIAFSGEEKGLLGSAYYVQNPFVPIKETYAALNTDMIGRVDAAHIRDSNYIYVIGADRISGDLHLINEEANKSGPDLTLDYTFNRPNDPNRFYFRSDHYNFAKYGVPVIFYFSGVHEDYHKPTDTIEKLLPDLMEKRVRLAHLTAWKLLQYEGELKRKETE